MPAGLGACLGCAIEVRGKPAEGRVREALVAEGKRQEERMKTGLPLRARRGRYLKRIELVWR